ncbi:hypothetical protein ACI2KS_10820 [Pseudomonas sp. NPDC087358]|uniref:hypothetical protein n=1 Tax=Pseudomonas sp. NPDC087358 TaxID=3364439 RepID=UPI00384F2EBF
MHALAVKSNCGKIRSIAERSADTGDNIVESHFGTSGSISLDRGLKAEFDDLVKKFIKDAHCENTYSYRAVRKELLVIASSITQLDDQAAEIKLAEFASLASEYNTLQHVYQVVQGVKLRNSNLHAHGVNVFHCGESAFAEILVKGNIDIQPDKVGQYENYVAERKSELLHKVVMSYEVRAEPIRARELAFEAFSKIVDVLRYAGQSIESGRKLDIRLSSATDRQDILVVSDGNITQYMEGAESFIIDGEAVRLMNELECPKIYSLQEKPAGKLSDLEERVLRAIKWFSSAVAQQHDHVAYLHLVLALESLFTSDDKAQPISATISDAVAFLLSDRAASRLDLKAKVTSIYGKRSSIAHGSSHAVDSEELNYLAGLVQVVVRSVIGKLSEVSTRDQLSAKIAELKFFGLGDMGQ